MDDVGWSGDTATAAARPRRPRPAARVRPSREVLVAELRRICRVAAAALDRDEAALARTTAAGAVRLARRLGQPELEGTARLVYGRCLGYSGSLRAGLEQIGRAEQLLEGEAQAEALLHRSALLYKMGEPVAALESGQRALALLPDEDDHDRARALNNVGVVLLYLGQSEQARASLAEAERLHRLAARPVQAAETLTNLAMARARLGDLVGALRGFDDAAAQLGSQGLSRAPNTVAKAEVLLDAGLLRDVRSELPPAIAALDLGGMRCDAAEGLLYLALGLVGLHDPGAVDAARDARQRFHQIGSAGWEAMASLVEVRARWVSGDVSEDALVAARRTVAALARRRLPYELEAQMLCGQLAEALGRAGEARRRLAEVAAGRSRGTVRQRSMGWEAQARVRLLDGNRPGALRAADAGLRVIERHRDAIGAADLRAGASSSGMELASLALGLAVDGGQPCAVLRWAERWRAGALYRRPVLPPHDAAMAGLLAEMRQTAVAMRGEATAGRPAGVFEAKMVKLERTLANRIRTTAVAAEPGAGPSSGGGLDLDELRASLGPRALVEYVECKGDLVVVVLDERRCVVRRLGGTEQVGQKVTATAFALRKLARLVAGSPAAPAALAGFKARLDSLRAALIAPVLQLVGGRELVVVPTGRLHAVPWQLLVGAGRVVAVAPSAALWQRAAAAADGGQGAVVVVAGPGLPGAVQEVETVGRHHASAVTLTGGVATVKAVTRAIDGAGLVHLAAHGDLRRDNPLFSSFRLVDGPQTVYDLQCLSKAPDVVVLSACNSALSEVGAGDELLGLVASLLSFGTSTAIAAVLPISDLATVPLMDRLHRRMSAGARAGPALSDAASDLDPDDPGAVAAAAAFVCLGAA